MSCNLYFKPFLTKSAAVTAKPSITGAFAVVRITNDPNWWYVISKEASLYYVNYKDGRYQVESEDVATFDALYTSLTVGVSGADKSKFIRREDLINTYKYDTPIAIKSLSRITIAGAPV